MVKTVYGRKLLMVEDDEAFRSVQAEYFRKRGNAVVETDCLSKARELLAADNFDAVILDVILPDGEGLELLATERNLPPVIILSSMGESEDLLEGFNMGAADYQVKPCPPELLEARLSLRLLPKPEAKVSLHGLTVDVSERKTHFNGKQIALTGSEFNILYFLMTHKGEFFNAADLYEKVWRAPFFQSTSVKYHISNLRQKLIKATGKNLIITEFGRGYSFLV